jgi:hypothetical protein
MNDKYPRYTSDFADLSACVDAYVLDGLPAAKLIAAGTKIVTQGSCFALNIYEALAARGLDVKHFTVSESSNSPVGNAKGLRDSSALDQLRDVDVFIFTMGVSLEALSGGSWRFCSVDENVDALRQITSALRAISPSVKIIYSVSPVPMNRAIGLGMPAVMADCLSKSTLRVSVDMFMRSAPEGVFYWPSFEIVRWLGAHTSPAYGADDGNMRHVNRALVDIIVEKFLSRYGAL